MKNFSDFLREDAGEKFASMSDEQFADWKKSNPGAANKADQIRSGKRNVKQGAPSKVQSRTKADYSNDPLRDAMNKSAGTGSAIVRAKNKAADTGSAIVRAKKEQQQKQQKEKEELKNKQSKETSALAKSQQQRKSELGKWAQGIKSNPTSQKKDNGGNQEKRNVGKGVVDNIKGKLGSAANAGKGAVGSVANAGKSAVGKAINLGKRGVGTAVNLTKGALRDTDVNVGISSSGDLAGVQARTSGIW